MKCKKIKTRNLFFVLTLLFLLSSCVNGYKDDWTFSAGVENQQLGSPDSVSFVKNAEGTIVTVSWTVVYGALNYKFQFLNVTDPDNPVTLVDEIVDGCYKKCAIEEDSNYKVLITAIGNPKLNNTDAISAKEVSYSTMIPAIIIPDGSDLYQYFSNNPIPQSDEEQAYELEAGGSYSLSGELDLGSNQIILRGSKAKHPLLTYGVDGRLIASSKGFVLKFIDIDCNAVPKDGASSSAIMLNPIPDESLYSGTYYVIENPILFESCIIKGINSRLFYDNDKAYSTSNLMIKDCIIGFNYINKAGGIYAYSGYIDNLTIANSTFYSTQDPEESSYFIRYKNNARGTASKVNILNSTFYNIMKLGQFANYSGINNASVTLTFIQNLFVDCGNQNVIRRLSAGGNNAVKIIKNNCYWYDGAFPEDGEINHNNGEKSASPDLKAGNQWERGFGEDPGFTNPAEGNFTVSASASNIISKRCGDPRWLPEQ